jgi:hypothetical protein
MITFANLGTPTLLSKASSTRKSDSLYGSLPPCGERPQISHPV